MRLKYYEIVALCEHKKKYFTYFFFLNRLCFPVSVSLSSELPVHGVNDRLFVLIVSPFMRSRLSDR